MSQQRFPSNRLGTMAAGHLLPDRLFLSSQVLLLAVLAVAPWTLGGVAPAVQLCLFAGVLASGLCWLASWLFHPGRNQSQRLPLLLLPIVLGLVFGALQLIPAASLSQIRLGPELSLGEIPLVNPGLTRESISIYPLATRVELARLTFALLAFFLASQLFASRDSQVWLFGVLTVTGLLLGFFGIAQKLGWNGQLFWHGPVIVDGKPFASFVNRNNAAGYLNLTLAAAFGFLIWSVYREKPTRWLGYRDLSHGLPHGRREYFHAWLVRMNRLSRCEVLAGTGILLISAGVIASASRGGILAMACGLATGVLWMFFRGLRRMAIVLTLGMIVPALGLIAWLGMTESIQERFAELSFETVREDGRSKNWRDVWEGVPQVWGTGSGFGTYRYFHRPFQRHSSQGVYAHAENQYLETLVEGGAVGLGLLILAISCALMVVVRLARSRMIRKSDGVVVVGLVALVTQLAQSLVDFGLVLPANALTMAVLMGAVSGRAVRILVPGASGLLVALPELRPRFVFPLFAILLLGNGVWSWMEILREARAAHALNAVRRFENRDPTEEELSACLTGLEAAIRFRPDDVQLHLHSAEVRIRLFERRARQALDRDSTIETNNPARRERILNEQASLSGFYVRMINLENEGFRSAVESIRNSSLVRETLFEARKSLLMAQKTCPWLPQVELYLAYLSVLMDDPEERRTRLLRMAFLGPYDDRKLFHGGQLALRAGDYELAIEFLRRAFSLSHQKRYEILISAAKVLPLSVVASRIVPNDPSIIRESIGELGIPGPRSGIVRALLSTLDDMPEPSDSNKKRDFRFLWGVRSLLKEQWSDAQVAFESALAIDPLDRAIHVSLTEVYLKTGKLAQARRQIQAGLQAGMDEHEADRLRQLIESQAVGPKPDNLEKK